MQTHPFIVTPETAPARPVRSLRAAIAEGISLFVLIASGVRAIGWVLGARALLQPPLGTVPMQFGTAACFVATAIAVVTAGRGRQRGAQSISVAALCAVMVFIALYFLDLHVGGGTLPVRLPPESVAFAFALVHAGILARCAPQFPSWARHAAVACGVAAALIVLEAVAEQLAGGSGRASHPVSDIAIESMLLFILLAAAMWAGAEGGTRRRELDRLDRIAAWGTVLLAASVFLGWSRLESDFWRERIDDTTIARDAVVSGIGERLESHASALARLADRWEVYGPMTAEQFAKEAHMYLRDRPAVQGLLFAGPDHVARWHIARSGSGGLVGVNIGMGPRAPIYAAAAEMKAPRLTTPRKLHSGKDGVVIVVPVYAAGALRGYLTASLQLSDFLEQSGAAPMMKDFSMSLRDRTGQLLAGDGQDIAPGMAWLRQSATIDALGQPWTLSVWPQRTYLKRMRSGLPDAMFLAGLIAVGVVAAAFVQARRSAVHHLAAQRLSQRLATTLESITDAFFTLDRQMRFTYLNAEAERLLQRTRGELLGRPLWDEFPAARGTAFEENYRRALADNCTVAFEEYYPPLAAWFGVKAYPSPEGLAVYFQDVTQRRRSDEALLESERELRALAESMPQMVWMADAQGSTIYSNRRWLDYTGLAAGENTGMRWLESLHPDDRAPTLHAWKRALATAGDFNLENRMRGRDGQYRWMLVRAVPHRDREGRVLKWLGTCTDIDEMRQSADAVRASEERLRTFAKATNDGIWEWNAATGQLWWSENFERLFGVRDPEHASLERSTTRIHPEDRERVLAQLRATIKGDAERWSAEYRFMRSDGTFAHVLNRGYVIRGEDGRAVRIVGGMSDISERVALEEQLRRSQRLEAVGHLTGGLAHDFNNLLTVVLGNAETLSESIWDQQLRPLADMIVAAAERGADLTKRLLAFSRQEALAPVAIDVNRRVAELEPLLRRTLGEHIEITLPGGDPLWPALVDPSRFDSALLNLCLNARDAMPYGGELAIAAANALLGEDDVQRLGDVRPGEYVRVAVSDNGCGIRPEHMGRLFEPFFTTKEKGKGTGLGLSMVYGFIKQSGGHVHVRSELGHGTTVTLYLPRAGAGELPAPEPSLTPFATGREAILLVEDDFYVRTYARDQLRALGYQVIEVGSGAEALDVLRGPEPLELLLTDVVMPQMSGPELASLAQGLRPGLKVLYTSGYTEDALSQHGRQGSAVRLLAKPYLRDELARRVREALLQDA